jgi:hypothetical protein
MYSGAVCPPPYTKQYMNEAKSIQIIDPSWQSIYAEGQKEHKMNNWEDNDIRHS